MTTFVMLVLTLFTVLGGVILGWLARCYWLGGKCCDMMAAYEADGGASGKGSLGGGAIGTVAAGTAAMRTPADASSSSGSAGITQGQTNDENGEAKGLGALAAGAIGTVAAGASAVKAAGSKAVSAGTDAARTASEKVAGAASDARSSLMGDGASEKTDGDDGGSKGVSGLAAGALGTVAAGAAAVRSAGEKAVAAGTSAARTAGDKVSSVASDARYSLAGDKASDSGAGNDSAANVSGSSSSGSAKDAGAAGGAGSTGGASSSAPLASGANSDKISSGERVAGAESSNSTAKQSGTMGDGQSAGSTNTPSSLASEASAQGDATGTPSRDGQAGGGQSANASNQASSSASASPVAGEKASTASGSMAGGDAESRSGQASGSAGSGQTATNAAAGSAVGSGANLASPARDTSTGGAASSSAGTAAGLGGAALAGAAAASGASSDDATSEELEASRAEVRGLRKRLGLSGDSDGSDSTGSVSDKLAASREEARALRQDLWTKQQAETSDNDTSAKSRAVSGAAASASTGGGSAADRDADSDFGALSTEEAEAQRLITSGSAPKKPSNALAEPTGGFDPDDLTKIRGIGKPTQGRLNRNGIYYYDQIAEFTAADLAWADTEMNLEGRAVSDRWIPQAKLLSGGDSGATDASNGDDESVALVDVPSALTAEEAEAERLLASGEEIAPPASRLDAPRGGQAPDDLTKIKGIGPKINGKLNDQGIYYYDQIAAFSGSDLAWADRELDFKGRAVRDRWVPQAQGLMDASALAGPSVAAPAGLLSEPIEGRDPDDLTAIKGVGDVLQKQLNEKGIYYYSQIAEFSDSDQEWANQTLGFPGRVERDNWIPQARELMESSSTTGGRAARLGLLADAGRELDTLSDADDFGEISADESEAMRLIESGEFVADESNRPAELLSSPSQGAKDDLKLIKGVGPKLEDLLNSLGIYYFRQVAGFSATDIAWVDSKLRFKGRIVRDRWVDQAKRLS
jgi:predicted flap endonuclease-1-like 5' DNA nuclease